MTAQDQALAVGAIQSGIYGYLCLHCVESAILLLK